MTSVGAATCLLNAIQSTLDTGTNPDKKHEKQTRSQDLDRGFRTKTWAKRPKILVCVVVCRMGRVCQCFFTPFDKVFEDGLGVTPSDTQKLRV